MAVELQHRDQRAHGRNIRRLQRLADAGDPTTASAMTFSQSHVQEWQDVGSVRPSSRPGVIEQRSWYAERLLSVSSTMSDELRYALRTLRNNPSFAAVAILTVALGVGANTAMFSVVEGVLLKPLDYPNASRIVQLNTSFPQRGRSFPRVTGPDAVDIRAGASLFEQVSFYAGGQLGV